MVEGEEVVAAEQVVAAVPAVDSSEFFDVNEDGDWELEGAVGLDEVEHVWVKSKLYELQEKCRAKKRTVVASVGKAFSLAIELRGSVDAHMSMAERASCENHGKDLKVEPETMKDEQDGSRKAFTDLTFEHAELRKSADVAKQLVDAQIVEAREDHARKLDTLRSLHKARKGDLSQDVYK